MDEPRGSTSEIIKQRRQILYDLIHCGICFLKGAFVVAQMVKNPPIMQETWVQSLSWDDPLERERLPTPVFLPGEVAKSWTRLSDRHSLYISTVVHLALSLIALSFQEALNDTISHPAFIIWLPSSDSGVPGHRLLPAACSGGPSVTPQLLLCVLLYGRGLPGHFEPFQAQSLPGSRS